jgi:hypothetical protein
VGVRALRPRRLLRQRRRLPAGARALSLLTRDTQNIFVRPSRFFALAFYSSRLVALLDSAVMWILLKCSACFCERVKLKKTRTRKYGMPSGQGIQLSSCNRTSQK